MVFRCSSTGFASGQATSVAACEPLGITQLENPADAVSAILEEATHSDQPLIFSAHSIETYLASRNSQGEKQGDAYGETGVGAPATEPVRRRRTKSAANLIQSVVKHYFIEPVASINNVVCTLFPPLFLVTWRVSSQLLPLLFTLELHRPSHVCARALRRSLRPRSRRSTALRCLPLLLWPLLPRPQNHWRRRR
jgi:hypothetical protein